MKRYAKNPILTRADIVSQDSRLQDVSSVFNPGGVAFHGKILLLLRVQNRARETFLLKAISKDGIRFQVSPKPVDVLHLERCPHRIYHIYDPRISPIGVDGWFNILCAMDTEAGCFLGFFRTEDFETIEFIGLASKADVRNGVLFPNRNLRFERPNNYIGADGVKTGNTIICSRSEDFLNWQEVAPVFAGRPYYWDELIGSGPPPLKTRAGWLHIYHGVATHFGSANIYQVGVSLHDLSEPWHTVARGKYNILEPRESYEFCGQVPNVVFPTAAVPVVADAEGYIALDTPIHVYYGAADTCVCLAITTARELLKEVEAQ